MGIADVTEEITFDQDSRSLPYSSRERLCDIVHAMPELERKKFEQEVHNHKESPTLYLAILFGLSGYDDLSLRRLMNGFDAKDSYELADIFYSFELNDLHLYASNQ